MADTAPMKLALGPALKRNGITQAALADKIGVSKGFISEITSGKKRPSVETLEKIAQAMGVEISELYETQGSFAVQSEPETTPGLSEARQAVFTGQSGKLNDLISAFISGDLRHPAAFIATATMLPFGILKGDVLILDLNAKQPQDGLVLATIADPITGSSQTIIRRIVGDLLISPDPNTDVVHLADETHSVGILGEICGTIRGKTASNY